LEDKVRDLENYKARPSLHIRTPDKRVDV